MRRRGIRVVPWLLICGLLFACQGGSTPSQSSLEVPTISATASIETQPPLAIPVFSLAPNVTSSPVPTPTLTPTPTPTPTATPTPTPIPTPTPTPEPITEERLASGEFDSYFDDAIIIGDSLTKGFSYYVHKLHTVGTNALGEAKFMGTAAMSVKNACTDQKNSEFTFTYRGLPVTITEGINAMEARKAFILLGLNDISCRRWEDVEGYFSTLIEVLQKKCPDIQIIIQGIFPVTYNFCRERGIRIDQWNSFNERLGRICEAHHVEFYDFGFLFMDSYGYMKEGYSDGGFHLSDAGDAIWLHALRFYAAQKMYPGAKLPSTLKNARLMTPNPTSEPTPTPMPTLAPTDVPTPETSPVEREETVDAP